MEYYTPERIEHWLKRYHALETAVHLSCAVENMGDRNGSGRRGVSGLDTDLLCVLCDIDKAVAILSPLHKALVTKIYLEGHSCSSLAKGVKKRKETVLHWKDDALKTMSEYLEGGTT